jgi:signal transduction histidine kinase
MTTHLEEVEDAVALADIVVTDALAERTAKPPEDQRLVKALVALARCLASCPGVLPQCLVDAAMDLTGAASAGLSLHEVVDGQGVFRWVATCGELSRYAGETLPGNFSPCGMVLKREQAMVMKEPARVYPYVASLHVPIFEVLLVPFSMNGKIAGTLWVCHHDPDSAFDRTDLAAVDSLSSVAGPGLQAIERIDALKSAQDQQSTLLKETWNTMASLQQWFDHAPGFIALLRGPDLVFEMINRAYYTLTGHREVVGKPFFDALPELRHQGFEDPLQTVRASGQPFVGSDVRIEIQQQAGGPLVERFLDFVYQPVFGPDKQVAGIFVQGHDVTEKHRATDRLKEADRRKDQFITTIAHELRNPLAPIRQAAWIGLAPQSTEAQRRRSLEIIDRQSKTMSLLLDDLVDVSRVSMGRMAITRRNIALRQVLCAASETARPLMDAKGHRFIEQLPAEDVRLDADPLRLTQVFTNLLANAAKYTNPGGEIRLVTRCAPDEVSILVQDNGIGLAPESLAKVFQMFSQVKATSEQPGAGIGIGLALAKGLVELHGGHIDVDSPGLERGCVFTVRLPIHGGVSDAEP